jgi:hypothetical protein
MSPNGRPAILRPQAALKKSRRGGSVRYRALDATTSDSKVEGKEVARRETSFPSLAYPGE